MGTTFDLDMSIYRNVCVAVTVMFRTERERRREIERERERRGGGSKSYRCNVSVGTAKTKEESALALTVNNSVGRLAPGQRQNVELKQTVREDGKVQLRPQPATILYSSSTVHCIYQPYIITSSYYKDTYY